MSRPTLTCVLVLGALAMAIPVAKAAEPGPAPPATKTVMVLQSQVSIPDTWIRAKSVSEQRDQARWSWEGLGSFVMTRGSGTTALRPFVDSLKKSFETKGYQLVTERPTKLDGQPAIALDVEISRKMGDMIIVVQQRIYCVNTKKRFYTLIFATEKKRWPDSVVRRVGRSFRAM